MPHYRLYLFDGPRGHIRDLIEFDAATDGEASAKAATSVEGRTAELWCEGRKIERFEGEDR